MYIDDRMDVDDTLPKYREMLLRLARDPVGQTLVFHVIMRLFFQHVIGVRPECVEFRRGARRPDPREWCTDGIASSACAPGIVGPVAAFRGEIEAQGRGSLHPHILVWLLLISLSELVEILNRDPEQFQRNIYVWMKAAVAAAESVCQSSVQALPRQFGELDKQVAPLGFSDVERGLSHYDGKSELDELRAVEEQDRTDEQRSFLDENLDEDWVRPRLDIRDPKGKECSAEELRNAT